MHTDLRVQFLLATSEVRRSFMQQLSTNHGCLAIHCHVLDVVHTTTQRDPDYLATNSPCCASLLGVCVLQCPMAPKNMLSATFRSVSSQNILLGRSLLSHHHGHLGLLVRAVSWVHECQAEPLVVDMLAKKPKTSAAAAGKGTAYAVSWSMDRRFMSFSFEVFCKPCIGQFSRERPLCGSIVHMTAFFVEWMAPCATCQASRTFRKATSGDHRKTCEQSG